MSGHPNLAIVRTYRLALHGFRAERELSPLEDEAYQRLSEAADRLEEFENARLDDLHLQDAVRLAHSALK